MEDGKQDFQNCFWKDTFNKCWKKVTDIHKIKTAKERITIIVLLWYNELIKDNSRTVYFFDKYIVDRGIYIYSISDFLGENN